MSACRSRRLGLPVACLWLYTVHAGKIGCTDPPSLDFGGGLLPLGITDASCQLVLTVACSNLGAPAFSAVLGGNECSGANVCTMVMSDVNVALGIVAAAVGLAPIVWTPPAGLELSDRVYDACPSACAAYSSSPGCISPSPPPQPNDARLDETATIRIDAHETTHPINVATGGSWEIKGEDDLRQHVDGLYAWDLSSHVLSTENEPSGSGHFLIAREYTMATWVRLRAPIFWGASLFRGAVDECMQVTFSKGDPLTIGYYSERMGNRETTVGTVAQLVADEWLFIAAVGVRDPNASSSQLDSGTTTYYIGNQTQPPVEVGSVPKACSGDILTWFGYPSQGPGYMSGAWFWNANHRVELPTVWEQTRARFTDPAYQLPAPPSSPPAAPCSRDAQELGFHGVLGTGLVEAETCEHFLSVGCDVMPSGLVPNCTTADFCATDLGTVRRAIQTGNNGLNFVFYHWHAPGFDDSHLFADLCPVQCGHLGVGCTPSYPPAPPFSPLAVGESRIATRSTVIRLEFNRIDVRHGPSSFDLRPCSPLKRWVPSESCSVVPCAFPLAAGDARELSGKASRLRVRAGGAARLPPASMRHPAQPEGWLDPNWGAGDSA